MYLKTLNDPLQNMKNQEDMDNRNTVINRQKPSIRMEIKKSSDVKLSDITRDVKVLSELLYGECIKKLESGESFILFWEERASRKEIMAVKVRKISNGVNECSNEHYTFGSWRNIGANRSPNNIVNEGRRKNKLSAHCT